MSKPNTWLGIVSGPDPARIAQGVFAARETLVRFDSEHDRAKWVRETGPAEFANGRRVVHFRHLPGGWKVSDAVTPAEAYKAWQDADFPPGEVLTFDDVPALFRVGPTLLGVRYPTPEDRQMVRAMLDDLRKKSTP